MGQPKPGGRAAKLAELDLSQHDGGEATCVKLHSSGALVLVGTAKGSVQVYSTAGALVQRLGEERPKQLSTASCVAWDEEWDEAGGRPSGRDRIVVGYDSGSVRVWDAQTATALTTLVGHRSGVTALATLPSAGLLASGSQDTNIKLWRPAGGREPLHTLKGHAHPITQLCFTPDGTLLASGDAGGGLRLWVAASGEPRGELRGHTGAISALVLHPHEMMMASAGADRTLLFWDLEARRAFDAAGPEGTKAVQAAAFPADGRALLAAHADGLRVWGWEPAAALDAVELPWAKVVDICCSRSKLVGCTLHRGAVGVHAVDLTQVQPWRQPSGPLPEADAAAALASGSMRFSEKHPVPAGSWVPSSSSSFGCDAAGAALALLSITGAAPLGTRSGPAAQFVQQMRQEQKQQRAGSGGASDGAESGGGGAVLAVKTANTGPPVEVFMAAGVQLHSAQAQPRNPSPARMPAAAAAVGSRKGPSSWGRQVGLRLSDEENVAAAPSKAESPAAHCPTLSSGAAPGCQEPAPTILPSLDRFAQAALSGHADLRGTLRQRKGDLQSLGAALRGGDWRGALGIAKQSADPALAANTLEVLCAQRHHDTLSLELCTAAAPLAAGLLALQAPMHHDVALQLLEDALRRWGGYVAGVLGAAPRQGRGVDLEFERRHRACTACRDALRQLAPPLERLAAEGLAGGRARQLLARVQEL